MSFLIKRDRMGWESLAQYNRVMFWFLLSQRMFPLALHRHHHCTHHMNTQKMSEANMSIAWIEISH